MKRSADSHVHHVKCPCVPESDSDDEPEEPAEKIEHPEKECPICYDAFEENRKNELLRTWCCKQAIHLNCRAPEPGEIDRCPFCRATLPVDWPFPRLIIYPVKPDVLDAAQAILDRLKS